MILVGCGGFGFLTVTAYRYQEQSLQQLIKAIEYMECELRFRMSPLPELCIGASQICTGCVKSVLRRLGDELERQALPNVSVCMQKVIEKQNTMPERIQRCLLQLGDTLGRFDLAGQLQGLESVKKLAEFELDILRQNKDVRLRSYQTLGICAGAALVVLFL